MTTTLKEWRALSKAELERQFLRGHHPSPLDLLGFNHEPAEWVVHMLTGVLPDLSPFRHRKRFELWNGQYIGTPPLVVGCNICFRRQGWGHFHVEAGRELLINYAVVSNGRLTQRIRDLIRTTPDPNVMLGKFHIMWRGRMRFIGFFTLTRLG